MSLFYNGKYLLLFTFNYELCAFFDSKKLGWIMCFSDSCNFSYVLLPIRVSRDHSSGYIILQYISTWNRPEATHIYTVSITYFVFKVLWKIFQETQYYPCDRHQYLHIYSNLRTEWYRDAAKLIRGFIGARKKRISKISSCRHKKSIQ